MADYRQHRYFYSLKCIDRMEIMEQLVTPVNYKLNNQIEKNQWQKKQDHHLPDGRIVLIQSLFEQVSH